jgi:hypothetical protein
MSERLREERDELPTVAEVERREREGWRLSAVEWRREGDEQATAAHELPYGLRVSEDGFSLAENAEEQEVLRTILAGLVADRPLGEIAADLEARGYRTRRGVIWSQASIFELLPRLVEAGPGIFRSPEWQQSRKGLRAV